MLFIIHRVNTISQLKQIPHHYGVEVDVRAQEDRLILQHNAFEDGDDFEEYLRHFSHAFIVLNIKESGIEDRVIARMKEHNIIQYFLLDVEFPYQYQAVKCGIRELAVRYSEGEPLANALMYKGVFDWVWIDTITKLPLDDSVVESLNGFKTCLVCPERWGRPGDISEYAQIMQELNFAPTAIMTSWECVGEWERCMKLPLSLEMLLDTLERGVVDAGNYAHVARADATEPVMDKQFDGESFHDEYVREKMAVSSMDTEVQNHLLSYLIRELPRVDTVGVLAEETDTSTVPLLGHFSHHELFTAGQYTILIDPIDGSRNYMNGSPNWSVIAAVLRGREMVGGVIYYPALGADGILLRTWKGGGMWLNGERVLLDAPQSDFSVEHPIRVSGSLGDQSIRKIFPNIPSYGSFSVAFLGLISGGLCKPDIHQLSNIPYAKAYVGENIDILDLGCCALAYAEAGGVVADGSGEPIVLFDHAAPSGNRVRIMKFFVMAKHVDYVLSLIQNLR